MFLAFAHTHTETDNTLTHVLLLLPELPTLPVLLNACNDHKPNHSTQPRPIESRKTNMNISQEEEEAGIKILLNINAEQGWQPWPHLHYL